MLIAKNDEEKRSRLWRNVTISATVLIVVVAVYFLYKGFFGNPLEGAWMHDESDLTLDIMSGEKAVLTWNELYEGTRLEVNLNYVLDKSSKEITFKAGYKELERAAAELGDEVTASDVESAVQMLTTSFHYSIERNELTLTEWDYGDQLLFTKIQ